VQPDTRQPLEQSLDARTTTCTATAGLSVPYEEVLEALKLHLDYGAREALNGLMMAGMRVVRA